MRLNKKSFHITKNVLLCLLLQIAFCVVMTAMFSFSSSNNIDSASYYIEKIEKENNIEYLSVNFASNEITKRDDVEKCISNMINLNTAIGGENLGYYRFRTIYSSSTYPVLDFTDFNENRTCLLMNGTGIERKKDGFNYNVLYNLKMINGNSSSSAGLNFVYITTNDADYLKSNSPKFSTCSTYDDFIGKTLSVRSLKTDLTAEWTIGNIIESNELYDQKYIDEYGAYVCAYTNIPSYEEVSLSFDFTDSVFTNGNLIETLNQTIDITKPYLETYKFGEKTQFYNENLISKFKKCSKTSNDAMLIIIAVAVLAIATAGQFFLNYKGNSKEEVVCKSFYLTILFVTYYVLLFATFLAIKHFYGISVFNSYAVLFNLALYIVSLVIVLFRRSENYE